MVLATAMVVASVVMAAFSFLGGKSKKGKKGNQDPIVGNRYWGDTLNAYAYVSENTAALWANRVYAGSEEPFTFTHLGYANYIGEEQNIGASPVNTALTTAFNVPFDAVFTDWAGTPNLHKANKIPRFTRAKGETPQYPAHLPGVAMFCGNQVFMGMNAATMPSFVTIWTAIPGSMYYLLALGEPYNNSDLWLRWRKTIDLGWTVGVNPTCIVADLLLDQHTVDDINWESFAYAGKRLVEQHPYMWFHCAMGVRKQKDAIKDILEKARMALKQEPDGRIGLKLTGDIPDDGPAAFTIIDALRDLEEFSVSMPSVDSSDVINEVRGTYMAARFDVESDFERLVLPADKYEAYKQWEAAHAGELEGVSLEEKLRLFPGMTGEEAEKSAAVVNTQMIAQFEGHLLEADAHAVNTGNIVLTGVRRQESYNLDFLAWPDDAKAYLEEVLVRNEQPYATAQVSGAMWMSQYTVGDIVRLAVRDDYAGVQMDKVFEVMEVTIVGYPEEKVELVLRENHTWYDSLTPLPDGGTDIADPTIPGPGLPPDPVDPKPVTPTVFSVPMFMHLSSPLLRGVPVAHFETTHSAETIIGADYYLVPSCDPTVSKDEDNIVGSERKEFAINAALTQPFELQEMAPGHLGQKTITARVLVPPLATMAEVKKLLEDRVANYAGTSPLLFNADHSAQNWFILSTATETVPSGQSLLFRATNFMVYELDGDLYVDVSGIYFMDVPTALTFGVGCVMSILPQSSSVTEYGYGPVPLNAAYPITPQAEGNVVNVKTVTMSFSEEVGWDVARCAAYELDGVWLDTQRFTILADAPSVGIPAVNGDTLVVTDPDADITFMFNAPDYTHNADDPALFGVTRAYRSGGLEPDKAVGEATVVLTGIPTAERKTGITKLKTALVVSKNGVPQGKLAGTDDPMKKTVTLRDLSTTIAEGDVFDIDVEAFYALDSNILEEPMETNPTIAGRVRVIYGSV